MSKIEILIWLSLAGGVLLFSVWVGLCHLWSINHCPAGGRHYWQEWGDISWHIYVCTKCDVRRKSYEDLTQEYKK